MFEYRCKKETMKPNLFILLLVLETAFGWHVMAQTTEFRVVKGKNYDVNNFSGMEKTITIPAGNGLENTREMSAIYDNRPHPRAFPPIHFDGTIKPIHVGFILPEMNSHTRNVLVSIDNFPYTPDWFKKGQLRIVEPVTQLTIHYDVFRGLVAKSNLVFRVFPLYPSYSRTNYDALGHATISIIPAHPIFDYGLPASAVTNEDHLKLVIKGDAAQMSLVAGIYQFSRPDAGRTDKMDLRSDGTAQTWFFYGDGETRLGKKNVKWSAAGGLAVIDNSTFKIEGDDLIDASANRWLHVR